MTEQLGALVYMARYDDEVGRIVGVSEPKAHKGKFHPTGPVEFRVLRREQGYAVRMNPGEIEPVDHDDWPVHQPDAPEAPIPGRHWYSGCDPDRPRVDPFTGVCEGCGMKACRVCGREDCPNHAKG